MSNRIELLPNDMIEIICYKLHRLYMKQLIPELYEESLEYEWRKEYLNSDADTDTEYQAESQSEDDSEYSYYSSDSD